MRALIQRVSHAAVAIENRETQEINTGLLILLGIEDADTDQDIEWLCNKITKLRIFNDAKGIMNLSLIDIKGSLMIVSQFTLHASTKKGNRPSYIKAGKPEYALSMYNSFIHYIKNLSELTVKTGEFGADMKVSLLNDGPVTIFIDSKNKE